MDTGNRLVVARGMGYGMCLKKKRLNLSRPGNGPQSLCWAPIAPSLTTCVLLTLTSLSSGLRHRTVPLVAPMWMAQGISSSSGSKELWFPLHQTCPSRSFPMSFSRSPRFPTHLQPPSSFHTHTCQLYLQHHPESAHFSLPPQLSLLHLWTSASTLFLH